MVLKKIVLGLFVVTVTLLSDTEYVQGIKHLERGNYVEAFPIVLEEAKKDVNKAAQYRLAEMYEKGFGTEVDYKKASYWYKKAASKYNHVEKKKIVNRDSLFKRRIDAQFDRGNANAGNEFALSKVDTHTPETKSLFTSMIDGDFFGLTPHKVNYLLPFSYSKNKANRVDSTYGHNGIPNGYNQYNEKIETMYQLSLKKQLTYNLFGLNESIFVAYTQKVWWQVYDISAPFRETNYQPEIFMMLPTSQSLDDFLGLKVMKIGFIHESNGQEGYRSRSWNRVYTTGIWQWDNLFLSARAWYRIKEDRKPDWYYEQSVYDPILIQEYSDGDDNPDISDYLGYGDIEVAYLYGKNQFGLLLRNNLNFKENKGAVEFRYSYPLFNSPNTFWYAKGFTGYGDSLIDYNVHVTKASFGFSFSGGLF